VYLVHSEFLAKDKVPCILEAADVLYILLPVGTPVIRNTDYHDERKILFVKESTSPKIERAKKSL